MIDGVRKQSSVPGEAEARPAPSRGSMSVLQNEAPFVGQKPEAITGWPANGAKHGPSYEVFTESMDEPKKVSNTFRKPGL